MSGCAGSRARGAYPSGGCRLTRVGCKIARLGSVDQRVECKPAHWLSSDLHQGSAASPRTVDLIACQVQDSRGLGQQLRENYHHHHHHHHHHH